MSKLNRRQFLKRLTASAAGATIAQGFMPFGSSLAFAEGSCAGSKKVLVSIFLNGGPHGPSILVPRNTQAYFDKHPTLRVENSLVLDNDHGLHPNMPNLHALFTQGKVVLMNGAGYPNHSRSHEDSTSLLGKGLFANNDNGSGWGGRFAANYCAPNEIFSLFSFRGNIEETQWPGLSFPAADSLPAFGYGNDNQGNNNNRFLRQAVMENRMTSGIGNPHQQAMLNAWEIADASVATVGQVNSAYVPGVTYPNGLGPKLRDAAKLIISPLVAVRHIFINQGGYDTHGNQNGTLPNLLTNLDASLSAFWNDLVARGVENDVVVIFHGEFGRTHENAGQGTDHGTGFFMGMLGNNLRGGVASPAYTSNDFTSQTPWVPVKLDYREVIEQVLSKHQSVDPGRVFPEAINRIGLNLFL